MSDIERIKDAIRIEDYIQSRCPQLKRAGTYYKMSCPRHADKSPSFVVNPVTQTWQDYGACGVGGDVYAFVMWYDGGDFADALHTLAEYAHITLTPLTPANKEKADQRERLYTLMDEAATYYHSLLYTGGPHLDYLMTTRGLADETIKAARIGYAPGSMLLYKQMTQLGYTFQDLLDTGLIKQGDQHPYDFFSNRIVIPMCDHKGRVVGFSGRDMGEKGPKYLNTPKTDIFNKGSLLYTPTSRVKNGQGKAQQTIVVVEGHMDAISALNRGFTNVVAQMGTSLTSDQLSLLCRNGVERLVFCLDKDAAGRNAAVKAILAHAHAAADRGVSLYVMSAPYGKDPDDTFRVHPELWPAAVDAARPAIEVLIELSIGGLPQNATPTDKQKLALSLLPLLKGSNPLLQEDSLQKLAAALGYPIEVMRQWTDKQPDIRVLPKPVVMTLPMLNVPQLELTVMHGLLNNDEDRWLDRANAALMLKGDYPHALSRLTLNDFTHPPFRTLMTLMNESPERPFDDYLIAHVGEGPLHEVYYRAACRHTIESAIVAPGTALTPLDYGAFLRAVFTLRRVRIERDTVLKLIPMEHILEFMLAKRALS